MFLNIIQALVALPKILGLLKDLGGFLKDTFGDNTAKFIVDSSEAFKALRQSKTEQEKIEALNKIQDLLKRI